MNFSIELYEMEPFMKHDFQSQIVLPIHNYCFHPGIRHYCSKEIDYVFSVQNQALGG